MAQTASAFGFSAIDPIGTLMANKLDAKYGKGMMKYQAKLEHKYRLKAAEEMPSSARAGLIRAGYNPILAINGGANGDYGTVSVTPAAAPSGSSGGFDAEAFHNSALAKKFVNAQVSEAEANAETAKIARSSAASALMAQREEDLLDKRKAYLENLLHEGFNPKTGKMPDGATMTGITKQDLQYINLIRDRMQHERYVNSKWHTVNQEVSSMFGSPSSAFSNLANGLKGLRRSRSFNFWITPKERRAAH